MGTLFFGANLGGSADVLALSPSRLRQVSLIAAGLLVGTALVIIVPEGIHMWIVAQHEATEAAAAAVGEVEHDHSEHEGQGDAHHHGEHDTFWMLGECRRRKAACCILALLSLWSLHLSPYSGASLTLGFAFMVVVERLGTHPHGHSHGPSTGTPSSPPAAADVNPVQPVMLGLIIHCAVDGVALGKRKESKTRTFLLRALT